jgi:hypothetical protein
MRPRVICHSRDCHCGDGVRGDERQHSKDDGYGGYGGKKSADDSTDGNNADALCDGVNADNSDNDSDDGEGPGGATISAICARAARAVGGRTVVVRGLRWRVCGCAAVGWRRRADTFLNHLRSLGVQLGPEFPISP